MENPVDEGSRRISVDLPNQLIDRFDELKREWGLRGRGAVVRRLLEDLLGDETNLENSSVNNPGLSIQQDLKNSIENIPQSEYNETKALVLIGGNKSDFENQDPSIINDSGDSINLKSHINFSSKVINLPGFVQKRSENMRASLDSVEIEQDALVSTVNEKDLLNALKAASEHWINLYGQPPGETVVEASMIWLARDIWPRLEFTEGRYFTWSEANRCIKQYCSNWKYKSPSFERVIVIAGVLEDPFGTANLAQRTPTLIRRFVNRFKRSHNVTSFQTLESTMTVHGALKLLDLPTKAGASLTLLKIRDSYKLKAMTLHPDAGGSTDAMRQLNEAYQLLKELYRKT